MSYQWEIVQLESISTCVMQNAALGPQLVNICICDLEGGKDLLNASANNVKLEGAVSTLEDHNWKQLGQQWATALGPFQPSFLWQYFSSYLTLMQSTSFNPLIWHFLKLPLIHVVLSFNSFWPNPDNRVPPLRLSQLAAWLQVPWEEGCFSPYLHIPNLCCGF